MLQGVKSIMGCRVQRVKGCRGVDVKLIAISILFHTVHISHIPCMSNMPSTS